MPAWAQWTVTSSDGASQIKLGFLTQMQVEGLKSPGSEDWAQNVFVRRARLMLGGRIDPRTSFFIDTETASLGKGQASGAKVVNTVVLQDVVLTRMLCRGMNIDAGMMYTPSSHHSLQSVGSLLAMDYSPFSFLQSERTGQSRLTSPAHVTYDFCASWLAPMASSLRLPNVVPV